MLLCELTKEQFIETMDRMTDITEECEPIVDIWGYAGELNRQNLLSEHMFENRFVEAVYRNYDNSYHHVMLFGQEKNVYIVIVVDVKRHSIMGHYLLDINKEYGLNSQDE